MTTAHPSRVTLALVGALAASLLAVATAGASRADARIVFGSGSGFDSGPALASDGRALIAERRFGDGRPRVAGSRRVLAFDPGAGSFSEIAAFGPASAVPSAEARRVLSLTGTGAVVTASLDTIVEPAGAEPGVGVVSAATTTMTILPTLRALTYCGLWGGPPQLDAAGGENFVATIGDECGALALAVRLRTASGTITIPTVPAIADVIALRATGPMVAWVQAARPPGAAATTTLVIARGATGEILLRTPLEGSPAQIGLAADGTVVFNLDSDLACALRVVSPAEPAVRRIELPVAGGLCPSAVVALRGPSTMAAAGGRIVYRAISGYGVTDLHGATHALGDAAQRPMIDGGIAFDGRTVYAVQPRCGDDLLVALDAGVAAQGTPPVPLRTRPLCVVQRAGPGRLRIARDGRVRISLRCPSGCAGTLRLVQQRGGRQERLVASDDFALDRRTRSTFSHRVRIARYARSLAGCRGGLLVQVVLWPFKGHSRGLGSYRLRSHDRCRRSGGPPYTVAREPRP